MNIEHSDYAERRRLIEEDAHRIFLEQVEEGIITLEEAEARESEWLRLYHQE